MRGAHGRGLASQAGQVSEGSLPLSSEAPCRSVTPPAFSPRLYSIRTRRSRLQGWSVTAHPTWRRRPIGRRRTGPVLNRRQHSRMLFQVRPSLGRRFLRASSLLAAPLLSIPCRRSAASDRLLVNEAGRCGQYRLHADAVGAARSHAAAKAREIIAQSCEGTTRKRSSSCPLPRGRSAQSYDLKAGSHRATAS